MRHFATTTATAALAATLMLACALPASAACTRLAFSVNDYGKDGPTKDAKGLLDKYVAKWAVEHNIAKYQTGKKDVSCELFLNFIVFDEHTCRAEATVCWDGPPVAKSAATASTEKPAATEPGSKPAIKRAAAPSLTAKPKADIAATTPAPAAAIETGTLPVPAKPVVAPVEAAPATPKAVAVTPAPADEAKPAFEGERSAAKIETSVARCDGERQRERRRETRHF